MYEARQHKDKVSRRIDEVSIESHGTNYCYTGESTASDYVFVYDANGNRTE